MYISDKFYFNLIIPFDTGITLVKVGMCLPVMICTYITIYLYSLLRGQATKMCCAITTNNSSYIHNLSNKI